MSFEKLIVILFLVSQICGVTIAEDSLNVKMLGEVHDFIEEAYDVAMSGN